MRKIAFILGILALGLAGCGQADTSAPPATSAPTAIVEQPSLSASPTPSATPTAAPTSAPPTSRPADTALPPTQVAPPAELVTAAQQRLARYLKVSADDLELKSAQPQEWPDGGLGCPSPDLMYPQVVTPGYLLIFVDKTKQVEYEVHTGTSTSQIVLCENKRPIDLSAEPAPAPALTAPTAAAEAPGEAGVRMGELARAALAKELGLSATDIAVIAIEETTWNDSSLGCPQPDQNYLQVITPGYTITLEAQGKRYKYHADSNRRVVRCDRPLLSNVR